MKIDKSTQKCCVTQTIPWTRSFGSNYTLIQKLESLIQKLEYSNCITCTTIQIITYNTYSMYLRGF